MVCDATLLALVAIQRKNHLTAIVGNTLEFDMLLWATGAAPVEFLAHTGLDLDARGFLQVDQYLLTSDPSIFAAGRCLMLLVLRVSLVVSVACFGVVAVAVSYCPGDCVCFTPHPVAKVT